MQLNLPNYEPQRLAIKLSVVGERSVRSGHPWVFSDSIIKQNKEGEPGDLAIVFSFKKNEVLGIGLFDPDSPIRIKMLFNQGPATINKEFFSEKIARAFSLRAELMTSKTNSYRLLFGENDGFPGVISDVYDQVMVLKLYSAIWLPYLKTILEELILISGVETVVIRLSRNLQQRSNFPLKDGQVVYGELQEEEVAFKENGVNFTANVIKGHKTGYFLDHRQNRIRVGKMSDGKTVLDVFSYAGGFSVHSLVGGAKSVTSIDISKQALEVAKRNAALNKFKGEHNVIEGDAFELLNRYVKDNKKFEVVVIDPPSFAKRAKEIDVAKKKYAQLANLGSKLVGKKGVLVLASCSSRVTAEEFYEINESVFKASKRKFEVLLETGHDTDHPITFEEGAYLKTGYYKFLD